MKVTKRDGTVVDFDRTKIENAIQKAFDSLGIYKVGFKFNGLPIVLSEIGQHIDEKYRDRVSIENIQDIVEECLMNGGLNDVAKAYILYREDRAQQRKKRTPRHPDPLALSEYIHYAKYAKYLPDEQRRETYLETSHRCRDMHLRKFCKPRSWLADGKEGWGAKWEPWHSDKEKEVFNLIVWAWEFVDKKIVLPSMRSMQFGGEAIEDQNTRMYNCSFTHIDRPEVFQQIFYLLLCGCGVGFSVQKQHVVKLPCILQRDKKKLRHHTVQDSIQGWADSIGILMDSFFIGYYVEFDYSAIRPQGSLLKISGGKAPGHFPLKKLHNIIVDKLLTIHDRRLYPIECHDIICHIADSVLSGGIRRSSLISLFSIDDEEMLYSKMPSNFEHYGENGQRALANNSVMLLRNIGKDVFFETDLKVQFMKIMELNKNNLNGEPGFFFTNDLDYGCNPCGEIGLYPVLNMHEYYDDWDKRRPIMGVRELEPQSGIAFCNLTEVNCAAIKTKEEFFEVVRAAAIIGTLQAAYTDFKYLGKVTEEIVKRDALLGVSLTGVMDNPSIALHSGIQKDAVLYVKDANGEVAELIGINKAKRLTTIKPSGTASLLLGGVCSGIHPHHSKRYFRRITVNRNEQILKAFIKLNPQMIEYKPNGDIALVFPIESPTSGITLKDMNVQDFLTNIFNTYDNWVKPGTNDAGSTPDLTHNISCTVCFKPEEYEDMVKTIWGNRERIASMAFIPFMSDKMLPFMPRESVVTEEDELRWNKLINDYKPIDYSQVRETDTRSDLTLELACTRGNGDCGVVSVEVEDTVEILDTGELELTEDDPKYKKYGIIQDSFGNKLITIRRK